MCVCFCVCSWSPGWWCPHWQTLLPAARQNLRWAPSPRTLPSSPTLPRLKSCQVTPNTDTVITTFIRFSTCSREPLILTGSVWFRLSFFSYLVFLMLLLSLSLLKHTHVSLRVPAWHLSLFSKCGRHVLCHDNMCFDVKHNTCVREWLMSQKQR